MGGRVDASVKGSSCAPLDMRAGHLWADRYGVPNRALVGEAEVEQAQQQRAQQQAEQEAMAMQNAMAQTQATQASGLKDAAMAAQTGGMI